MRALRIHLKQSSANYRREETIDNKMTYPLPPYSTVIGALHNACKYTEYHDMDISIQGTYGSMGKEVYFDNCFLNNLQNDRGILVKMSNEGALSNGFVIVAEAKKAQGNDFRKGITIDVINQTYLDEYRNLKDIGDEIEQFKKKRLKPVLDMIKIRKKSLAALKKNAELPKDRMNKVIARDKEIKQLEKEINQRLKDYEAEHYGIPISKFRTLTRGPKFYEVLYDVELIIHVASNEETLNCIYHHLGELTSIGRSEDFVELIEEDTGFTELHAINDQYHCEFGAYLRVNSEDLYPKREGIPAYGTRYLLNKNYVLSDNGKQRRFNKKLVTYVSNFDVDEDAAELMIDDKGNIVSLV
ncbi:MAG: CRISPR-associated protein Cas5 [Clostridium sp.]|nr:CRISPR-associated protein Cas5 [Clostridium sp.]